MTSYIRPMLRLMFLLPLLVIVTAGCDSPAKVLPPESFGPTKIKVQPTFTQVKDWTADGHPDGIEVVVEIRDSFDEPTRGAGTFIFELSDYRPEQPNTPGHRMAEPWVKTLLTRDEQTQYWSPALRAYTFQLPAIRVGTGRRYILDVSFETAGGASKPGGTRLFDRIVVEPPPDKLKPDRNVSKSSGEKVHR